VKRATFHAEAEAELVAAAAISEAELPGLGVEFIAEVERATHAVVSYPKIGHRFSRRLRRVLVRRFPYGLLYRIEAGAIRIVAVAHVRRRPGFWRQR
jgi:plasmid stabilization system protein ParE